ncbi:MAG: hypothetical protein Q8K59_10785 [Nitrosomonas sp.]|nr:hypothetical protein [Nitrosomonas sp.]MDP1951558.1 hypothetical protein [Nitrosomonas sp.]
MEEAFRHGIVPAIALPAHAGAVSFGRMAYVATVGERTDWGVVARYVKNQGKPKEELRQLALF